MYIFIIAKWLPIIKEHLVANEFVKSFLGGALEELYTLEYIKYGKKIKKIRTLRIHSRIIEFGSLLDHMQSMNLSHIVKELMPETKKSNMIDKEYHLYKHCLGELCAYGEEDSLFTNGVPPIIVKGRISYYLRKSEQAVEEYVDDLVEDYGNVDELFDGVDGFFFAIWSEDMIGLVSKEAIHVLFVQVLCCLLIPRSDALMKVP